MKLHRSGYLWIDLASHFAIRIREKSLQPSWLTPSLHPLCCLKFFIQGDLEHRSNLPISPLMDRTKEGITKSQPGFFSIVALPLYQSFSTYFPGCRPLLDAVRGNYRL